LLKKQTTDDEPTDVIDRQNGVCVRIIYLFTDTLDGYFCGYEDQVDYKDKYNGKKTD